MVCTYPPRPQWNHIDAKTLASTEIIDKVRHWASLHGIDVESDDNRDLPAMLALTLIESPDSYAAGLYLDDFLDWPVDGELVRILDSAYRRMKTFVPELVHAWVMENKVRFPAKKDQGVFCRIGDLEFNGRVDGVVKREARALIIPLGKVPAGPIMVNAEEVLQVINIGSNNKGPGGFPTGGTPVAAKPAAEKKVVNQ